MGCFSGLLMSAASDQKLFCELCSAFNCSFDEFVGEKVVSSSYSFTILALPSALPALNHCMLITLLVRCDESHGEDMGILVYRFGIFKVFGTSSQDMMPTSHNTVGEEEIFLYPSGFFW